MTNPIHRTLVYCLLCVLSFRLAYETISPTPQAGSPFILTAFVENPAETTGAELSFKGSDAREVDVNVSHPGVGRVYIVTTADECTAIIGGALHKVGAPFRAAFLGDGPKFKTIAYSGSIDQSVLKLSCTWPGAESVDFAKRVLRVAAGATHVVPKGGLIDFEAHTGLRPIANYSVRLANGAFGDDVHFLGGVSHEPNLTIDFVYGREDSTEASIYWTDSRSAQIREAILFALAAIFAMFLGLLVESVPKIQLRKEQKAANTAPPVTAGASKTTNRYGEERISDWADPFEPP